MDQSEVSSMLSNLVTPSSFENQFREFPLPLLSDDVLPSPSRRRDAFAAGKRRTFDVHPLLPRWPGQWDERATRTMSATLEGGSGSPYSSGLVDGPKGGATKSAIKEFQKDDGLVVDGIAGPLTNAKPIRLYMDKLSEATLVPEDFVGDPKDRKRQWACAGCGASNPVGVASDAEGDGRRATIFPLFALNAVYSASNQAGRSLPAVKAAPPLVHGHVHIDRVIDQRLPGVIALRQKLTASQWDDMTKTQETEYLTQFVLGSCCPPDSFFIGAHGTSRTIQSTSLGEMTVDSPPTGSYIAAFLQDSPKYKLAVDQCKFVVVIACNTGNEAEAKKYVGQICFAQELAYNLGMPCFAPQGYLETTTGQRSKVWPDFDWVEHNGTGTPLKWKMFYPRGWSGGKIKEPEL
jgi:peptidoglycan hydrolase-like protein with peptidoglycan-binding domain